MHCLRTLSPKSAIKENATCIRIDVRCFWKKVAKLLDHLGDTGQSLDCALKPCHLHCSMLREHCCVLSVDTTFNVIRCTTAWYQSQLPKSRERGEIQKQIVINVLTLKSGCIQDTDVVACWIHACVASRWELAGQSMVVTAKASSHCSQLKLGNTDQAYVLLTRVL